MSFSDTGFVCLFACLFVFDDFHHPKCGFNQSYVCLNLGVSDNGYIPQMALMRNDDQLQHLRVLDYQINPYSKFLEDQN